MLLVSLLVLVGGSFAQSLTVRSQIPLWWQLRAPGPYSTSAVTLTAGEETGGGSLPSSLADHCGVLSVSDHGAWQLTGRFSFWNPFWFSSHCLPTLAYWDTGLTVRNKDISLSRSWKPLETFLLQSHAAHHRAHTTDQHITHFHRKPSASCPALHAQVSPGYVSFDSFVNTFLSSHFDLAPMSFDPKTRALIHRGLWLPLLLACSEIWIVIGLLLPLTKPRINLGIMHHFETDIWDACCLAYRTWNFPQDNYLIHTTAKEQERSI